MIGEKFPSHGTTIKVLTVPLSYNVSRLVCSQRILCSVLLYRFLPPGQTREQEFGKVPRMEVLQENAVHWVRSGENRGAMVPGSDCRVENFRDTSYTSAFGERLKISNNRVFSHLSTKNSVIISCPHIIGNIAGSLIKCLALYPQ